MDSIFLEKLDRIARTVRNCDDVPFGGIQLIVTGDFFQLPPVQLGGSSGASSGAGWAFHFRCSLTGTVLYRTCKHVLYSTRREEVNGYTVTGHSRGQSLPTHSTLSTAYENSCV